MSTSDPGPETVLNADRGNPDAAESTTGMASLPDLAVITRLANEFFTALPGQAVSPGTYAAQTPAAPTSGGVDGHAIPVAPTQAAGISNVPRVDSPTDVGFSPAAPGLPAYFLERESANSPTAAPAYPSVTELFTFPDVPGAQRVPSVPILPSPAPSLTESDLSTIPAALIDTPWRPQATSPAYPGALPGAPAYFVDAPRTSPFGVAPTFPSQVFSFPSVPGSQSDPGALGSPATAPTVPDSLRPVRTRPGPPSHPATTVEPQAAISTEPRLESLEFRPELIPNTGLAKRLFDPHIIKRDFPILQEQVHGRPLIWLDNAATTQKPNVVIDRIASFYQHENSNIHRAAHTLAARATDAYEGAREKVRRFLNASSASEIIFVRGATEGINLVAKSWGQRNIHPDDEIVITWLEHHANIVPWQQLAAEKGARLRVAPVDDSGQVILEEYEKLLGPRTRVVSFSQVSNALGTVTPAKQIIEMAHRHGARVMVDAAQSVAHMTTDVQALDCDFLVFSGHKIFAPTGVGVVFGKGDLLETTPPWQGGGNMIIDVTFEKTVYNVPPARFEAGTGTIADAVGLGAALDYLDEIGLENVSSYERELVEYGTAALLTVPGLRLIGTAREKAGVLSFVLDSIPPEQVGKALDQEGIAVRAGHHCAQPILRRLGVEKTVRPSLALYNTREDVDALVAALRRMQAEHGMH